MMVEANDNDSPQAMVELLQLCFISVLEAISCASVKKELFFQALLPKNLFYCLDTGVFTFLTRLKWQLL